MFDVRTPPVKFAAAAAVILSQIVVFRACEEALIISIKSLPQLVKVCGLSYM